MRGLFQTMTAASLAALLTLTLGCGNNNNNERASGRNVPDVAAGPPPSTAGRVNLYPMSAPPPGSQAPIQGYAPTRITTSGPDYYAGAPAPAPAPGYAGAPGYGPTPGYGPSYAGGSYSTVGYNPGQDPFMGASAGTPFRTPTGYCTFEDVTAGMNPNVPMADPPSIVNTPTGSVPYGRGYMDPQPGSGLSYGRVEGTADIAIPIGAGGYPSATTYMPPTTTYAQPLSTTTTYSSSTTYMPPTTTTTYSPPAATYSPPPATTYAPPLSSTSPAPSYGAGSTFGQTADITSASASDAASFKLVPAPDVPPGVHANDAGPSQWYEIIRPGNGPIRIGRVNSTCVCVGVRVPNRFVAAGERALIEARMVTRSQVSNVTYGIYVSILEPVQTMVDADITVQRSGLSY